MRTLAAFYHDGGPYLELLKDDEADVFESDDEAWQALIGRLERIQARCPNATDKSALELAVSLLNNWREPMACLMRGEPCA